MNRIITIILSVIIGFTTMFGATNPLRIKDGSLTPLKTTGGKICCVLDFSKTKANRKPLAQYLVEDFDSDIETFQKYEPEMLQWFMERWDDDIEEGPRATTSDEAKFTAQIVVKTLQMGAKSGYGGASISGYANFYKKGETEPFAVVEILKMNGTQMGGAMYGYIGLKQIFSDLAEYLCDLIYHN